jgi:3-isopropylmalate/(R)-2-methylmalate dehydratase large subunit
VGILKGVCAFREPRTLRVNLRGSLPAGVYAKDVILALIAKIGVAGATGMVMELRGPVIDGLSMEGRMTICNMAIEAGATSGICMPDKVTVEYLWPFIGKTDRAEGDKSAEAGGDPVYAGKEEALADFTRWRSDDDAAYAGVVDLDCGALEPCATVDYKPDRVAAIRELAGTRVDQVYIGSCTNGRIEDLRIAAAVLRGRRAADSVRAILSPATTAVFNQAMAEGLIQVFLDAGFCVTNPTCGACLGMSNGVLAEGEVCASTTNRNFWGRMGKGGMVHLMSPASAAATAVAGTITTADKL